MADRLRVKPMLVAAELALSCVNMYDHHMPGYGRSAAAAGRLRVDGAVRLPAGHGGTNGPSHTLQGVTHALCRDRLSQRVEVEYNCRRENRQPRRGRTQRVTRGEVHQEAMWAEKPAAARVSWRWRRPGMGSGCRRSASMRSWGWSRRPASPDRTFRPTPVHSNSLEASKPKGFRNSTAETESVCATIGTT